MTGKYARLNEVVLFLPAGMFKTSCPKNST